MRPRTNDLDPEEKDFLSRVQLPACPDVALMEAAHEGVLPESKVQQLSAHLRDCAVCRTFFEDLDAIEYGTLSSAEAANIRRRIEHDAPRAFASAQPSWIRKRWWVPALAFAACLAIAFVVTRPTKTDVQVSGPQVAQAKPLPEIAVEKLPIRVDPTTLLATRGGQGDQPSGPELAKALAKYQADDYAAAVQQLKALAGRYPKDGVIRLYLGVSELLINQNADAAKDLSAAAGTLEGARAIDSQWYLAAAELRLKDGGAALPLVEQICAGKSTYKEQACTLESQLK